MDRIALAKRLESLSEVFASHTPYNRDLKAMSYVLNKMADDKFTSIVSCDFSSGESVDGCMCGKGPMGPGAAPLGVPTEIPGGEPKVIVIKNEGEGLPMSTEATEKTAGMFWSREASKAVVDNLLRDVVGMNKTVCCDTGRKLETNQVPDGTHNGVPERAATLKPEQTPDIAPVIESKIVEKSHGTVQKEAASGTEIAEKREEVKKDKMLKKLEKDQKAKKTNKAKDASESEEEVKEEAKEEAKKDKESSSVFEGIELSASMDEFELDAGEASELSKLFE